MFELTAKEFENLKSQFATSSWGGPRYVLMAFTEHGVIMLASVLNSERAIQVNIQLDIELNKNKLDSQDQDIELLFNYLNELMDKHDNTEPRNPPGFKRKDEQ